MTEKFEKYSFRVVQPLSGSCDGSMSPELELGLGINCPFWMRTVEVRWIVNKLTGGHGKGMRQYYELERGGNPIDFLNKQMTINLNEQDDMDLSLQQHLWSDLQSLIPNLHVTSFHCRLFLLDLQIEHQDHLKLCQAGVWLENWPLEQQSKKKGFHAVEKILAICQHLNAAQDLIKVLQKQLMSVPLSDSIASWNEVVEITTSIAEQEKIVLRLSKQDNDLMAVLQLGDPISYEKLEKMRGHAWFEHQLNMRALKAHIIAKGGISKNAIIPPPINMKGLFGLDVNNDIWQDIGLADDEFDGTVPPWLGDEDVQNGIWLMKEVQWFEDKSAALMAASNACQEHIQTLCDLGKRWGQAIDALNVALPGELRGSQRHTNSQSGGVSLVFEVDSSDDEEDFELEPPLVLADSAILAAADYTHQQGLSSDEGSQSNGTDSEDE
ncbi:hypothetical protein BS47DRAFT_1364939 [Hydnum rufescens UP504]|uniref:Uncharacterized protein n=1 Tax=Hydnum rufescens UP504 TaxID=1448309 RepID=A0A9P6AS21_9AGAM|nr:hypothetical protein BS47DRAFT_1364939 [Hydnum rufescens UP504]